MSRAGNSILSAPPDGNVARGGDDSTEVNGRRDVHGYEIIDCEIVGERRSYSVVRIRLSRDAPNPLIL